MIYNRDCIEFMRERESEWYEIAKKRLEDI